MTPCRSLRRGGTPTATRRWHFCTKSGGYGRGADRDRPLPVSRHPHQSVLASVLSSRQRVVAHPAQHDIDRVHLLGRAHLVRCADVRRHRSGKSRRRRHRGRGSAISSSSASHGRIRGFVGLLHVHVPLFTETLGLSPGHDLLGVVLVPQLGHGGDCFGPDVLREGSTGPGNVRLAPGQVLDGTPSSGEVGAELNIYGGFVGDGLRDAEQQGRGGCELQLELRVRLRKRESRHFTLAPAKLEESETCQMCFLRRAALLSVVYGNTFSRISIPQYCESKRQ